MRSLDEIACEFGTDKSTLTTLPPPPDGHPSRAQQGHGYSVFYDHYFSPLRLEPIRLLEIGVLDGRSLKMWERYFPNGQFVGLDIDPACAQYANERTQVVIGDQADSRLLATLGRPDGFTIIIDDGSHSCAT